MLGDNYKEIRRLKRVFIVVDVAFIFYWLFALFDMFPPDWLFKDYDNPILHAWNFSFLPLDLLISATGFAALICHSRRLEYWRHLALISLVLTFCSGLQAIAFWSLRADFDMSWWLPNLFLILYPIYFGAFLVRRRSWPGTADAR